MTLKCPGSKVHIYILHTLRRPQCLSDSLYGEPFSSYAPFSEKCTEWPHMNLTYSRSKIPICMLHTPPGLKFSYVLLYDEPFSSYALFFGKVHRMTPYDIDMFRVKKTTMQVTYTPKGPHFRPFLSMMCRFRVTAQFWEKCTKWPRKTLTCSRSKVHICMLHVSQVPKFSSVSLNFRKLHRMTPNNLNWYVQGQKYQHACYIYTRGPNFYSFHSTMSHFRATAQFSERCTKWPQMTLASSRSKIPTCIVYAPLMPKFSSVLLCDELFLSYSPIFRERAPNDLKWPWHV